MILPTVEDHLHWIETYSAERSMIHSDEQPLLVDRMLFKMSFTPIHSTNPSNSEIWCTFQVNRPLLEATDP